MCNSHKSQQGETVGGVTDYHFFGHISSKNG